MTTNLAAEAALKGNLEAIKLMLESGLDLTITSRNGSTLISSAVRGGNLDILKILTIAGANLNLADSGGVSPIQHASIQGFCEAVKWLLAHGAEYNTPDKDGWTPLNCAARRGHLAVVSSLIEYDADMNCSADGLSPFHSAVIGGHFDVIQLLAKAGAHVNTADNDERAPLHNAARVGNAEMVSMLIKCGADLNKVDRDNATAINHAAFRGHLDVLKVLTTAGADVHIADKYGMTPVNSASVRGHVEVVEALITADADVNVPDRYAATPLKKAAMRGYLEVVKLLLGKGGADANKADKNGITPLKSAAIEGRSEVMAALIEFGADVNYPDRDGSTPLGCVAVEGHYAALKLLLESGANVYVTDNEGLTPLNHAAIKGHFEVVDALVAAEAGLNAADRRGWTPVNNAALRGHVEVVKALVKHGADVNIAEDSNTTPINSAALGGHVSLVPVLVNAGADVNTVDKDGWTPVNNAARGGHLDTVKALVACKANIDIPNFANATPLRVAASGGHLDIVKALVGAGANLSGCRLEGGKSALDKFAIADANDILQLQGSPLVLVAEHGFNTLLKSLMSWQKRAKSPVGGGDVLVNAPESTEDAVDLTELASMALKQKNDWLLKYLVELGCNVTDPVEGGGGGGGGGQLQQPLIDHVKDLTLRQLLRRIERERSKFPIHSALRLGLKDEAEILEIVRAHQSTVCDVDYMGCTAYQVAQQEKTASTSTAVVKQIALSAAMLSLRQLEFPCTIRCDSGFQSFRLNAPVSEAKVYYEVTLAADYVFQIGFAAHSWHPKSPTEGVGDCTNSIGIDGSRQCLWYGGKVDPLYPMPKWSAGTVVGVGIDLTGRRTIVRFFFDGALIEVPDRLKKNGLLGDVAVPAVTIQGAENQACDLNLGERPLRHKPSGYSSIFEHSKRRFNRPVQVWDTENQVWKRLRPEDGHSAHYWDDWASIVSDEGSVDLVHHVLSSQVDSSAEDLLRVLDGDGRCLIDIAPASCRKIIDSLLHFMGRYAFSSKTPEHNSKTCMVYLAKDLKTDNAVAVKLMNNADGLRQELESRAKLDLDGEHVIGVLESFNGDEDDEFLREVRRRGFGGYNYCIVMPAAQRNLHQILSQENVAGRDWTRIRRMFEDIVQCVAHLHSRQMIHGDLKPLNIMRQSTGKLILIDLDASRSFGCFDVAGRKFSSAFCPPEAVTVDEVTGQAEPVFTITQSASPDGSPALSTAAFDMWALGAILYEMCSGEPLFLSNYDNMLDAEGLRLLHAWNDAFKMQKLAKVTEPYARNMIARLLVKDPTVRMPLSAALAHPFVSGKTPARMVGDNPKYDVFLSYRVASDSDNAQLLYSKLTDAGLSVFWDKICLQDGVPWEDGFCSGLSQSKVFVFLISRGAVSPRFSALSSSSQCDNVLLEHQLALELREMGLVEKIYPMYIGEKLSNGHFSGFDWGCYGSLPDVVVQLLVQKLTGHLEKHALGAPLHSDRTVKEVVEAINGNQGFTRIEGEPDPAFMEAAQKIVSMCRSNDASQAQQQAQQQAAYHQPPSSPSLPTTPITLGGAGDGQQPTQDSERLEAFAALEAQLAAENAHRVRVETENRAQAAAISRLESDRRRLEAEIVTLRSQLGSTQVNI